MRVFRLQLVNNKRLNNIGSNAMDVGVGMLIGSAVMQAFEKNPLKGYNKFTAVVATATYLAGFVVKTCTEVGREIPADVVQSAINVVSDVK